MSEGDSGTKPGDATTTRKRKASIIPTTDTAGGDAKDHEGAGSSSKKQRISRRSSKAKGKGKMKEEVIWPPYFDFLFKVFKALNTVLAFCSSRKNFAITFPVVRSSVESLLKQPLELCKVAELKALLPDLVKFAYIPRIELRINEDAQSQQNANRKGRREASPDYAAFSAPGGSVPQLRSIDDGDEHVLILDFLEPSKGKKSPQGFLYSLPPALTPAATKKLVEKRNERFSQAVDELLKATPAGEDPVALLQAAARDHIPVDPMSKSSAPSPSAPDTKGKHKAVPEPQDRQSVEDIIGEIQEQDWYQEQIVNRRIFEAKEGQIGNLDPPLSTVIMQGLLDARQITSLYTHQVAAISALSQGKHVIVSTSTASGKSIIYQVPLLRRLEEDRDSTAIFIYPTKALAQDQKIALEQLLFACPGLEDVKVATYDGDTPQEQRAGIRETASVIFTNFDMIHASILPHENLWRRFLKNLKLLAVDELHYYSGVFGSHVAQILRRFRRVCAAVGNNRTRFVSCSATISNPAQHMKSIFGVDEVEQITEDGAPSGRKDFIVWDPPPIDPVDPSLGRHSSLSEATRLMRFLMARGIRVILFCKIRKSCELAMKTLRSELTAEGRLDILQKVMSYRGGYSPQDRRRIEREAFSGKLLGVVATNALELGVDIGILDAVIMLGFPMGGLASFRQQAGRAGRRARDALAVLVADGWPMDRHYVANPDELFIRPTDDLMIDLDSKIILEAHLQCAGQEMPLTLEDEKYFGPLTKELCETRLTKDADGWYHTHPKFLPFPAKHISIRGAEEEKYSVVDVSRVHKHGGAPRIIEEVEISRALFELYEGAVFIHQGLTFMVQEVSHDSKTAKLTRADVNWITSPRDFTNVDAVQTHRIREIKGSPYPSYYGRIDLKTVVFGYFKIRNTAIIDAVDVDTPPWERESTGMWMDIPKQILELLQNIGTNPAEAIHAAEHAFLNRFTLQADLGTECKAPEKEYKSSPTQRKRPARLIFYERSGKNGGTAVKAFDHVSDLLRDAHDTVEGCQCDEGCADCIISPSCRENNVVSSKKGALIVLKALLGRPIDADLLANRDEGQQAFETVVEATTVRVAEGVQIERA